MYVLDIKFISPSSTDLLPNNFRSLQEHLQGFIWSGP